MRIKLNLMQLTPDRDPAICWLHVDTTYILLIKQLKGKIQKVLREPCEIELCVDNIPFLDEDDIFAINENEEITVILKERKNYTKQNTNETTNIETNTIPHNNYLNINNFGIEAVNGNDSSTSTILPKTSKKRVRKRTHKKKKHQLLQPVEPVDNVFSSIQTEAHIICEKPSKMHKRFKVENEENDQQDDGSLSESSDEDILHVTREVVRCNSFPLNSERKMSAVQPIWKKENPLKTKVTKVPVFVRGQMSTTNSTPNCSYTENVNYKPSESDTSGDCDALVVDWKNMAPLKITNISELQTNDLLQFKILSMNEFGEPSMSAVITARLENINGSILLIQVLSGIKEFCMANLKFRMDDEEDNEIQREIEFEDVFELVKLV